MVNDIEIKDENQSSFIENEDSLRKEYRKPQLKELGDLRTLTLGGTAVGSGDSGDFTSPWDWPEF
jgi:hypothetical protein